MVNLALKFYFLPSYNVQNNLTSHFKPNICATFYANPAQKVYFLSLPHATRNVLLYYVPITVFEIFIVTRCVQCMVYFLPHVVTWDWTGLDWD